ncbi:MAG: nicotinate phosphoribosyltransferase [Candidatus Thermoplasmatota archaeon]|nr:nicotinate phosphoribosyltransferase [Candidatus Thermoplasmatota archaeon]
MRGFHLVNEDEIKEGKTTDIYFEHTMEIFEQKGVGDEEVVAEFTASSFPEDWDWAVFCGLDEVLYMLEGKNVDVYSIPEGTIFRTKGRNGVLTPVLWIEGPYTEFCIYETPLLGFMCHPSGVATKSARVAKVSGDSIVLSFGIRRMHPALAPVIDRAAYIGGCDGISCIAGAEEVGVEPQGTMPHALTIIFDDPEEAFKAFDEVLPEDVKRIALVDTYHDEKMESVMAVEGMGEDLFGVRLDTPSSRRGDLSSIAEEVRWELKERGVETEIICSGGMDEYSIPELKESGVDSFGVGTTISNARTINFAMDIVEKEGKLAAKRGKFSGKKQAYRCPDCLTFEMRSWSEEEKPECECGTTMEPMLEKVMEDGEILIEYPEAKDIRERVLSELDKVEADWLD